MTKTSSETKEENKQTSESVNENEVVAMRELLECGVHFGHQKKRWNPKMDPYIFTTRNGIHVIDLQVTLKLIKKTYAIVKDVVKKGGTILFVGTKKQAQEAIEQEAKRCNMPFVNNRWLGGLLTNSQTVRQSINKLKKYDRWVEDGTMDTYSKKEGSRLLKQRDKLRFNLEGIVNMIKMPSLVFIIDTTNEQLAVKEAQKLSIPIIGMLDTNADPGDVTYPIPANDDAIRATKLISSVIANAVLEGQDEQLKYQAEQKDAKKAALVAPDSLGIDSAENTKVNPKSTKKILEASQETKSPGAKKTTARDIKSKTTASQGTKKAKAQEAKKVNATKTKVAEVIETPEGTASTIEETI